MGTDTETLLSLSLYDANDSVFLYPYLAFAS